MTVYLSEDVDDGYLLFLEFRNSELVLGGEEIESTEEFHFPTRPWVNGAEVYRCFPAALAVSCWWLVLELFNLDRGRVRVCLLDRFFES